MSGSFDKSSPHVIVAIQDWEEYEDLGVEQQHNYIMPFATKEQIGRAHV